MHKEERRCGVIWGKKEQPIWSDSSKIAFHFCSHNNKVDIRNLKTNLILYFEKKNICTVIHLPKCRDLVPI